MNNKVEKFSVGDFLHRAGTVTVVDVRTPSEYSQGHIPGAINIPLFSDDERASVGTIYKKEGQLSAIYKGLDFAGPKMSDLLRAGMNAAGSSGELLVHCWRGGMRSESMAWLYSTAGIKCTLLEGGYKSFRRHILEFFAHERKVIVIGGLTGSGKTGIIKRLGEIGEQVIDLEGLANHKGSAFGALGMDPQPTSEQFANLLYRQMALTDPGKRLFLEDESRNIGSVFMPDEVYDLIRRSPLLAVMPDPAVRVRKLAEEYGTFPAEQLAASVRKIEKRLGSELASRAVRAIEEGSIEDAISIVLVYYDKSYRYGLEKRESSTVSVIETDSTDIETNLSKILEAADRSR